MPRFNEDFDGGLNTAADRADLRPGQVTQSTGGYYKPGDRRIHKIGGRQTFGTAEASKKIVETKLIQFDTSAGNDRLLALANGTLYAATDPSASGTFASLKTGLSTSATNLSSAHYNDRWYFADGYDAPFVVEADGTVRDAGMKSPTIAPTATPAAAADDAVRPTAGSGTFDTEAAIYDTDLETFGGASLSAAGSTTTTLTWGANLAKASRKIFIDWGVSGFRIDQGPLNEGDSFDDAGGGVSEGWNVTVKFEVSENNGSSFTTIKNSTLSAPTARQTTQVDFTDAVDASANLQVKITLTYNSGTTQATLQVFDVRIATATSTTANFTTTTGVYYAFTEYDQTRGLESPLGSSVLVTLSTQNVVTLTLPGTEQNSTTTHLRIYRSTDGGSSPQGLGLIGEIQSSETTFIDDFKKYDKDTQAFPLAPLLKLSTSRSDDTSGSALYFPQNTPPPELVQVRTFKGSLVGLSRNNPRSLHYSLPGRPESWPAIYVITSFPLEEHDKLIDVVEVGDALVIAAEEAMMRTFRLPRVVQGVFDASDIVKIKGAPGCVGRKALTAMPVNGDSHAAWVSNDGVYISNGETFSSISDDHIDWYSSFSGVTHSGVQITHAALSDQNKSNWILHWDKHRRLLYFFFSSASGGTNDLYYTIRIPTGRGDDQRPRWSGPHPGDVNSITSGRVSGKHRMWTGHTSDGKVYSEWTGNDDDSNSYDSSGNWPLIIRSRRIYGEDNEWAALSGNLRHTDFGTGQTATVIHTAGRDTPAEESSLTQTVALSGHRGTHYDIAYGGEWHEYSIVHTGKAAAGSALLELQLEARGLGDRGTVKVA